MEEDQPMKDEKAMTARDGFVTRSDGSKVMAANRGSMFAQLEARRDAARESKEQSDRETVLEMDALLMIRDGDGNLRRADPNDLEDRRALYEQNKVDVQTPANPDEFPLGVQHAFRGQVYAAEDFKEHFTPAEHRMPPDCAMLCHRFDVSEQMGHSLAAHSGMVNFVTVLPILFGMGMGPGRNQMQATSHRIISFYNSWMFDLIASKPQLTAEEIEEIENEVGTQVDRIVNGLKTAKNPQEIAAVDKRVNWPVPAIQPWMIQTPEPDPQKQRGLFAKWVGKGTEVNEKGERETVDVEEYVLFDGTKPVCPAEGNDMIFEGVYREPTREDLEEAVGIIQDCTKRLAQDRGQRDAAAERTKQMNNVARTLFKWLIKDNCVPAHIMEVYEHNDGIREAAMARCDHVLNMMADGMPMVTPNTFPPFFHKMVEGADPRFLRVLAKVMPQPPNTQWMPPEDETEDFEIPAEVMEWKDLVFRMMEPPQWMEPFLREHNVDYSRLHVGIRAYYLLNKESTTVADWVESFVRAAALPCTRPTPEWFAKWWQHMYNRVAPQKIPSWCNDYILEGVHMLSVMARYYAMRARMDAFITQEAVEFPTLINMCRDDINKYVALSRNIGEKLVHFTIEMMEAQEWTLVALMGISIPPEKLEVFVGKNYPLGRFLEVEDAVADWRTRGADPNDQNIYLNALVQKELEMADGARKNFMFEKIGNTDAARIAMDLERKLCLQHPNFGDNPKTCPQRLHLMLHMIYLHQVAMSHAAFNQFIREMAGAIRPALPSTHRKAHHETLIQKYLTAKNAEEITVEMDQVPDLEYVAESMEGIKTTGKRGRTEELMPSLASDGARRVRRSKRTKKH